MFLLRMVFRSFSRQFKRRLLIAVTVCLSATICVAMLGVVFDVGDKLNAELSTYGSNIVVQPKADAVVSDLYNTDDAGADPTAFLKESDAANIETTFWAYNITDFAPELNIHATLGRRQVPVNGTWFHKTIKLPTGTSVTAGVRGMRSWWKVDGAWARDGAEGRLPQGMMGRDLARATGTKVRDTVTLAKDTASGRRRTQRVRIVGIFDSGDEDAQSIYVPSWSAQRLADLPDSVNKIEVKALTTPENALARKAEKDPAALSQEEWETWYCTAYPSSIAYQIEEVMPDAVAKQVRQVAELQGDVLRKTQAVMILMTALSLVAAAIAVANLMASSIGERSSELALLKAIGATDGAVSRLMLTETAVISLAGGLLGAGLGSLVAQVIGHVVFGSGVAMRPMVFVLVFVLLAITILIASFSSIRAILRVRPAEVLHGR